MIPRLSLGAPALLAVAALALSPTAAADEVCYHADGEASTIRIAFEIDGAGFTGRFRAFEAEYCMPEGEPEAGAIRVQVDLGSVATGNRDLDIGVQEPEGLAVDDHPEAGWETDRIRHDNGRYHIEGRLTLRGETREESGRFELEPDGEGWRLTGDATVNRLDYGIGLGEFEDTDFIPNAVEVGFEFRFR